MEKSKGRFAWLELRPQQKFRDDRENRMLDILGHVTQFVFLVVGRGDGMHILVRVPEGEEDLFRTVPGITAVDSQGPNLGNMVAECLVSKGRFIVPLVDLRGLAKSRIYQKMWVLKRGCVMACFANNYTVQALSHLNSTIRSLERKEKSGGVLSSRDREELAAAVQKRDGNHSYFCCRILFGLSTSGAGGRHSAREDLLALGSLASCSMQNSFSHRISRRRACFSGTPKRLGDKMREFFGGTVIINPDTFVPRGQSTKNLVLTETELAYFVSFPEEHDIRTINFGVGATPTFVHGPTQEMGETDLTPDS